MKQLHDVMRQTVKRELANVHTTLVARVTKVNRAEGTIACQPVVNRVVNGETEPLPEFPDVPVITLQGGKHYISFPVIVDDYCLLFVSERCFDAWYEGNDHEDPADPRMFDYSDCFALVGVNPRGKVLPISEDNEILITTETGDHIRLVDEERIDIITKGDVNVDADGDINVHAGGDMVVEVDGDLKATVSGNATTKVTGNLDATVNGNLMGKVIGTTQLTATGAMTLTALAGLIASITGNLTATVTGAASVQAATVTVTSPATVLTGGTVKIGGVVAPTGQGALCGIPFCLFTGAPHTGELASGT